MEYKFKIYKVGGCVRDQLLNLKSNDIDYVIVIDDFKGDTNDAYNEMCNYLLLNDYTILYSNINCLTVKVKCNKTKCLRDYSLARKELSYSADSRTPVVTIGTLYDDLMRRDFTINSLALDLETNEIIDVCEGKKDLNDKILRTPIDAKISFLHDPLRILRGFRFSITKNMALDLNFIEALKDEEIWAKMIKTVNIINIRDEFNKMFNHSNIKTLEILLFIKKFDVKCYNFILDNLSFKLSTK